MAAPTPVSAFQHSATMVKAGVYLLARMHPAMAGSEAWFYMLTSFGAVTAVFASALALRQTDLKQAFAYTRLMALGTLMLFLGQESGYAMTAYATFLIVHSLYKAALFLVVGAIHKATGTREVASLGGLGRMMPVTAVAAAGAAMSMAGFPPFLGFIGKELKYAGALAVGSEPAPVTGAVLLANALMFAVAGIVAFRPFWRAATTTARPVREVPWPMLAAPVILAALGALFGLCPDLLQRTLVTPTVLSLTGQAGEARELTLWAGVTLPLILSIATFALGLAIYALHPRLRALLIRVTEATLSLDRGWDRVTDGLRLGASALTARVQTGRMTDHLAATFATVALTLGAAMILRALPALAPLDGEPHWLHLALAASLLAGAAQAVLTTSRMAAVAALGVVGIGTALVFIFFGAPDVAITQLLVEVLIVVLVSVVMLRLPRFTAAGNRLRPGQSVIALSVGAVTSLMLLAVRSVPLDRRLTDNFEAVSWPEAYGRNIVNVILVDFRARHLRRSRGRGGGGAVCPRALAPETGSPKMNAIILRAGARYLVGLLLLFSVCMLLRGHNEPGGGLIGGLIGATGFVSYAIACGTADARRALRLAPETLAVTGLGVALIAGLSAALFGDAFFTGQWLLLGATAVDKGLPLPTVLVFDAGVNLAVFGAILALVFSMEEQV